MNKFIKISIVFLCLINFSCDKEKHEDTISDESAIDNKDKDKDKDIIKKLKIDLQETTYIALGEKLSLKAKISGNDVTTESDFYLDGKKLENKELFFTTEGEHKLVAKKKGVKDSNVITLKVIKHQLKIENKKFIIDVNEKFVLKTFLNGKDVTNQTEFYVDGKKILGKIIVFPKRGEHKIIAKNKYAKDSEVFSLTISRNKISYKGKKESFDLLSFKMDNIVNVGENLVAYINFATKENIKLSDYDVRLGKHKIEKLSNNVIKIFGEKIKSKDVDFQNSFIEVLEHSRLFNRTKIEIKLKDGNLIEIYFEGEPRYVL